MSQGHQYVVGNSVIGQGGQAVVVNGFDSTTKQIIAVKIFSKENEACFKKEQFVADIFKNTSPKHVNEIYDVRHLQSGKGLIFMKKYQTDLFSFAFENTQELSIPVIKKVFRQVCIGVEELHRRGISHLDIKPENVLLDEKENAYLCDFGCAIVIDGISGLKDTETCEVPSRSRIGTTEYRAPEINSDIVFNPFKADIYSLGVLLHTLVTGAFPFAQVGELVNLGEIQAALPPLCFDLVAKLLTSNPKDRFSIREVLQHPWMKPKKSRFRKGLSLIPHFRL